MNDLSKKLTSVFFLVLLVVVFTACKEEKRYTYDGMVQGTYYHIVFYAKNDKGVKQAIDSIYQAIDASVSLWHKNSTINKVNNNENPILDDIFIDNFNAAQKFSSLTQGAFDVTVGALVKAHGFTTSKRKELSEQQIDSLLNYVGYQKVHLQDKHLIKEYPQTQLDFNAIAQGYTSDCIANYFRKHNINSFIIDVGGEVAVGNNKPNNKKWKVGIETPPQQQDASNNQDRTTSAIVLLENQAIVTSGNYRKFYVEDGKKYSHTIDPTTGKSVNHTLLSASVIAPCALEADALATAFMVMGVKKVQTFLQSHPQYPTYLIYSDSNGNMQTWYSKNFADYMAKE